MEIDTYQQAFERWDAFLIFVIKGFGGDLVDQNIRGKLFDLLLTSRYQILPVLVGEYPGVGVTRSGDSLFRLGRACMTSFWRDRSAGYWETSCYAM